MNKKNKTALPFLNEAEGYERKRILARANGQHTGIYSVSRRRDGRSELIGATRYWTDAPDTADRGSLKCLKVRREKTWATWTREWVEGERLDVLTARSTYEFV